MPASRARTSPVTAAPSARGPSPDRPGRAAPPSTGRGPGALCSAARERCLSTRAVRRARAGGTETVTVNCAASAPAARSSTATISVIRGPCLPRPQCTTMSTAFGHQAVERRHRKLVGRVGELADEAKTGERLPSRSGVDGGEALHAGGLRVRRRGSASRSRTSPTIATSGAIRRNPDTNRRRSTAGRSAGRRARLHPGRRSAKGRPHSKTSSATTTRRVGIVLGGATGQERRLSRARGAGHEDDREVRLTHPAEEVGGRGGLSMSRSTSSPISRRRRR